MLDTVHNWVEDHRTAVDIFEHCQGHCNATCRRDRRSHRIETFNAEGQKQPDPTFQ